MSAATTTRRRGVPLESRLAEKIVARTARSFKSSEDEYMPRASTRCQKKISYEELSDEEEEIPLRPVSKRLEQSEQVVILISDSEDDTIIVSPIRKPVRMKKVIVQDATGAGKIFVNFAVEIHQLIASNLSDKDICTYRLICKQSEACITPSFWRIRFMHTYDSAEHLNIDGLMEEYQFRERTSKLWTCFDLAKFGGHVDREVRQIQEKQQKNCLLMLQSLVLQSNAQQVQDENGRAVVQGKNLEVIANLLTGQNGKSYVDIVDSIFNTDKDRYLNNHRDMLQVVSATSRETLLYVVQICLASFVLHPNMSTTRASHFDISQYQVYSLADSQPLFAGKWKQDINVRLILHLVNFFKYHFKAEGEGLLAHCYRQLELDQVPQPWIGRIQAGAQLLASHWKGAHTYMEPETLKSLRLWDGSSSCVHADCLDGNETFEDISFFFDESRYALGDWPVEWERILCSDAFKDLSEKQPRGARNTRRRNSPDTMKPEIKQFWGSSRGAKKGHFFGRIHSMTTQQDFHGFQRMVVMKYYTQKVNGVDVYDPNQIYAYEGCVFPGGRLIVGRWWDARNDPSNIMCASGPFIWWNVDESTVIQPFKPEEAWEFLDSFHEPSLGLAS